MGPRTARGGDRVPRRHAHWHAATTATLGFFSKKKDSDVKVGNILNLEGGVGRDFLQGGLSAGFAYYATYKLTEDQLSPVADVLVRGKNRVYGLGPEATPRIDSLATEGLRLLNMNMETQCTPSRSSLMTGRWAIRSGTHSVPFGGVADGLTRWEVTIGEALSDAGYATGYYGKWHLGSHDGRLPNDQGFDEWFGIPRTTDESLWPSSPGWSADVMPPEHTMEGKKGEKSRELKVYDVDERRLIDAEITCRSVAFIQRKARDGKPFFAYVALTQPHLPTLPNRAFAGKTSVTPRSRLERGSRSGVRTG